MEPWYQMSGPTMDEVIKIVKTHKHFKHIDMEKYDDLINFFEILEEDDDIQNVYSNAEFIK